MSLCPLKLQLNVFLLRLAAVPVTNLSVNTRLPGAVMD